MERRDRVLVSRLLINGPLWAVFSLRFLPVATSVSRLLVSFRPAISRVSQNFFSSPPPIDLYRFHVFEKRSSKRRFDALMVRFVANSNKRGRTKSVASLCTFLCWKLMPKRVDARGSLRIIRIGDSIRTIGYHRMNRVSTLGLRVDFPMMRS